MFFAETLQHYEETTQPATPTLKCAAKVQEMCKTRKNEMHLGQLRQFRAVFWAKGAVSGRYLGQKRT